MNGKTGFNIAEYVSECLQLAILLEVSAYPKPGNVHRTADFQDTRYEHFLASAVALMPSFRNAAQRGVLLAQGKINFDELEVGKAIRDSVEQVKTWQSGGNTLLGTIILLAPIATAAGVTLTEKPLSISRLRKTIDLVTKSTTPMDAVNVYEAISIAKPGGLGEAPKLDATDPSSKEEILREKVTLYDVFKISSSWDSISSEWVNNYLITFDIGYPHFAEVLKETNDVNVAAVHTFLKILSETPDTLIARKLGSAKANEVSVQARQVLDTGALTTQKGRSKLFQFDSKLQDPKHRLNPGTTADLTATVLAVAVLNGYRP
ncbi:MAG: triphosphoribosyl-dephospho-CoA synthase [Candidatus Bathyarchaeota archaeon]|jgi:triphosphoribosyl-dephospho-CoA synthase